MNARRHVVSVLMANEAGALSRVVGLFSARGFNIESLNVAPTQNVSISRLTLVTHCDSQIMEQINKQLNKLIDVIKLVEIQEHELIDREMMMVKIIADDKNRSTFMQLADTFRGKVVDICPTTLVVELTGSPRKLDAFLAMLDQSIIRELARTGVTGVAVTGSGKCLDM
ncbi:acetolactate synthase small subunit [Suttonella sp. R2A3]|uniref:acetolactate synthase small subunit n=1 Tax=Suttonella sp. R2A3 TaxID=2908648 RepID=UPI001F4001C0|nr:acetolactate synthase small subunit [Suttonella sp. R2A3]UJF24421.1 acetolactate synthase small subunit [Suttonella sp. R2A3]